MYFTPDEWARFRRAFEDDAKWNAYVAKVHWLGPEVCDPVSGSSRRYGGGLKPGSPGADAYRGQLAEVMPLFEFILITGSRIGEVLDLRWRSIDIENETVSIYQPKVKKLKRLPLTSEMKAILSDQETGASDERVFRPRLGAVAVCWHPRRVAHAFAVARKLAGLRKELTPHALRRTAASWLYQSGQPSQYAQRLLGHASIVTTEKHYASLTSTDLGPSLEIVGRLASQHQPAGEDERRHDVATPPPGTLSSRPAQVIYGQ